MESLRDAYNWLDPRLRGDDKSLFVLRVIIISGVTEH